MTPVGVCAAARVVDVGALAVDLPLLPHDAPSAATNVRTTTCTSDVLLMWQACAAADKRTRRTARAPFAAGDSAATVPWSERRLACAAGRGRRTAGARAADRARGRRVHGCRRVRWGPRSCARAVR